MHGSIAISQLQNEDIGDRELCRRDSSRHNHTHARRDTHANVEVPKPFMYSRKTE